MRDYQKTKNNPYILPQPLYRQVLWLLRDYERLRTEYNNAIGNSPKPPDGQPRGGISFDQTEAEGIKRCELRTKINAIENAYFKIPAEYRKGVWNNAVNYSPYPMDADRVTYNRHKQKFIYHVAKNLYWI